MAQRNRDLPKHLLVYRYSAMGDVAMLPHALRALRVAYPDLQVTVASKELFRPFFEGLGVTFLPVNTAAEHSGVNGMWALSAYIRDLGVDAVADVNDVLLSKALRLALRFRGIKTAHIDKERELKRDLVEHGVGSAQPWLKHSVVRYCDVIRSFGFVFDDPEPPVKIQRPNPMGDKQGRWVGFAPFSAHACKTYPEDLARDLVGLLSKRFDRIFIHSGPGSEADFAAEMEQKYSNVTALWGRVKFAEEIDLISNLDCMISMDSLAMHISSLVCTPVVSLWGATHPALGFMGYGCDLRGVLQSDIECRPCSVYGNIECRHGDYRCLRAIKPCFVVDRVSDFVD